MSLNPLRVFLAIADTGSQRAAARALGLTQPAITKALKKLETDLDARLFERSVHGARPTASGLALLARARLIDTEPRHCAEELTQLRGAGQGSLAVALSHSPVTLLLPQVLRDFRRTWPDVHLRIAASTYPHWLTGLRQGVLDFVLAPAPIDDWAEDLTREPLIRTRLVPIVRRGHPLAGARNLGELRDAEWILPTRERATAQALLAASERSGLPRPLCRITCETLTGMIMTVASTDMVALVPAEIARGVGAIGEVAQVPIAETLTGAELCLIRRRASGLTPAGEALAALFARAARTLGGHAAAVPSDHRR